MQHGKNMSKNKRGYYAVVVGRQTGIFDDWETCKNQVHKYEGCKFKKFDTEIEALNYISVNKVFLSDEIQEYTSEWLEYIESEAQKERWSK